MIYVVEYRNGEKRGRTEKGRVKRRNANGENSKEEGEENHETIGEAEAAAFHVAWHRLPLKSLLLFVSSSKIMIVCPRDLLLGGAPPTRRVYMCVCVDVYVRVCAQDALEEHRDLSLDRGSGLRGTVGER